MGNTIKIHGEGSIKDIIESDDLKVEVIKTEMKLYKAYLSELQFLTVLEHPPTL